MLICPEQRLIESANLKLFLCVSKPFQKKKKEKDMPKVKAKL